MHFIAAADTDIGISRTKNQDSLLFKHADSRMGEILLAVVCDGMGGLSLGELASAAVVRRFSVWFDEELPEELEHLQLQAIAREWTWILNDLNRKMQAYTCSEGIKMGTTFTGMLFVNRNYMAVQVGDSRLYQIRSCVKQLTEDQTFVNREVERGTMTLEQARIDLRNHILLQCVGASAKVVPQILYGNTEPGSYMLCSDGLYHETTEEEIYRLFNPACLKSKEVMHTNARHLIAKVKERGEEDNISVVLIKAD